MYDMVILGGGPAGVTAALRARELGASVALIEKDRMGGTCTNDGCVPTRVLAKAARLRRDAEQFETYGLHTGDPPIVDFPAILARAQQVVYEVHEKKQLLDHLTDVDVTTYDAAGPAHFVDPHTVELENGQRIAGKHIVICVGGHARRLPFEGSEYALTHSDVWGMKELPTSAAIIGSGATGAQLASVMQAFGCQITLLDVMPTILPGEDPEVSTLMQAQFEQRGMEVITGIGGVERIEKRGDIGYTLVYNKDGQEHRADVDQVMLAVGWPGNTETLGLDAAGIETERHYIKVDDSLRTTADHIFAAGDITGKMMLVQSASSQARTAVENALLGHGKDETYGLIPHGGFTDPEYGSVGLTEAKAREQHGNIAVATVPYANVDRAVIDGRTVGFCKLIVNAETHQIVGAHVVGEQALEVVQVVAAGMAGGLSIDKLAELQLAYPTFAAVVGLAARQLVRELDIVALQPEWRALARVRAAEWERLDPQAP